MQKQAASAFRLEPEFSSFDIDGDGVINSYEVGEICPNLEDSRRYEIIARFDSNWDGVIDEIEFNIDDKELAADLMTCWLLQLLQLLMGQMPKGQMG